MIPTGVAVAIPDGHAGLVLPRSGLASKHGLTLANAPGLIDAGYRGEVIVAAVNLDRSEAVKIVRGRPHRAAGDRGAALGVPDLGRRAAGFAAGHGGLRLHGHVVSGRRRGRLAAAGVQGPVEGVCDRG